MNLSILRKGLPDSIGVPASVSLPFGTFERVLAGSSQNAAVADELKKLQVRTVYTLPTSSCPSFRKGGVVQTAAPSARMR